MWKHALSVVCLCLLVLLARRALAQDPVVDASFPRTERMAQVPAPSRLLPGFGQRFTSVREAYSYARAVAAASDRVRVEAYGQTVTGLPLLKAVVSAPENLARREEIQAFNRKLVDGKPAKIGQEPVTVWFGFSIHGDEASGVEAGLMLLYQLASGRSQAVAEVLQHCVVVMDLCTNPDGRERFVSGVRDRQSFPPAEDRLALDHQQPWPGGRTNHYLFDLNRDWFFQTQAESRARVRAVLADWPQVLGDFHEMGSDSHYYFSAPPAEPINQHVSPQIFQGWHLLRQAIGKSFDRHQWPYWSADVFPADFPGYGGSWPTLIGCVGLTFEQGTSLAGRVRRRDASLLTLKLAAAHHALAGWAVLRAAASHRAALLTAFLKHFQGVARGGARDDLPDFVLTPRHDPDLTRRLLRTLLGNGIQVRVFKQGATLKAHALIGGPLQPVTVPKGSLLVTSRQPLRPLVLALLDPKIVLKSDFKQAETRRRKRGKPSALYDVSAWNLPLLFGVEAWRTAQVDRALLEAPTMEQPVSKPAALPKALAWLLPGQRLSSSLLLALFTKAGLSVESIPFAFTAEDRGFTPGTLMIRASNLDTPAKKALLLRALRGELTPGNPAGTLLAVHSFHTQSGQDLGSNRIQPVLAPHLVVAAGPGVSAYSFGGVRWLLEKGLAEGGKEGVPCLPVSLGRNLPRALEQANVLVLPDGDGYRKRLQKKTLFTFLERGGTVVAFRRALAYLASKELGLLPLKRHPSAATRKVGAVPGAIVGAVLRTDTYLGWGLPRELAVQSRAGIWWQPVKDEAGGMVAWFQPGKEGARPLSGILTKEQARLLVRRPLLVEKRHGRGRVIGFTEDPTFRGASPGLWKLFLNACLLSPTMNR